MYTRTERIRLSLCKHMYSCTERVSFVPMNIYAHAQNVLVSFHASICTSAHNELVSLHVNICTHAQNHRVQETRCMRVSVFFHTNIFTHAQKVLVSLHVKICTHAQNHQVQETRWNQPSWTNWDHLFLCHFGWALSLLQGVHIYENYTDLHYRNVPSYGRRNRNCKEPKSCTHNAMGR